MVFSVSSSPIVQLTASAENFNREERNLINYASAIPNDLLASQELAKAHDFIATADALTKALDKGLAIDQTVTALSMLVELGFKNTSSDLLNEFLSSNNYKISDITIKIEVIELLLRQDNFRSAKEEFYNALNLVKSELELRNLLDLLDETDFFDPKFIDCLKFFATSDKLRDTAIEALIDFRAIEELKPVLEDLCYSDGRWLIYNPECLKILDLDLELALKQYYDLGTDPSNLNEIVKKLDLGLKLLSADFLEYQMLLADLESYSYLSASLASKFLKGLYEIEEHYGIRIISDKMLNRIFSGQRNELCQLSFILLENDLEFTSLAQEHYDYCLERYGYNAEQIILESQVLPDLSKEFISFVNQKIVSNPKKKSATLLFNQISGDSIAEYTLLLNATDLLGDDTQKLCMTEKIVLNLSHEQDPFAKKVCEIYNQVGAEKSLSDYYKFLITSSNDHVEIINFTDHLISLEPKLAIDNEIIEFLSNHVHPGVKMASIRAIVANGEISDALTKSRDLISKQPSQILHTAEIVLKLWDRQF